MLASLSVLAVGVVTARPASAAVIAHAPVATAAFREEVAIDATLDCSMQDCAATLYFRTSDPTTPVLPPLAAYTATPMTTAVQTSASDHFVVSVHGTIPPAATDTRGVDYMFSVTDGTTTSWFPGAGSVPQHVAVREPTRLAHVPPVVSYLHEPIRVVATANCATGSCSAELSYRTSTGLNTLEGTNTNVNDGLAGTGFTTVPMASRVVEDLGGNGQVLEYSAEIPAEVVDTNGVDYFIHASDVYTNSFSPGTSYVSAVDPVDGSRVAWHHVEVLSRPLVAHIPPAYYVPGEPLQVSAEVTSATGFPTVSILYRAGSQTWFASVAMTVRETPVRRAEGTVYTATGAIPGAFTAQGGVMVYAIAVNDGYQTTYSPASAGYVDSNVGYVVAVESVPL